MKTVTINLYSFDELNEQAQQKAIINLSDINVNHEWWDGVYYDAENVGLKITGFDLDRSRHATGDFIDDALFTAHKILNEHGKECDTYTTAETFLKERDEIIDTAERDENGDLADEYELDRQLDEIEEQFLSDLLEDYSIILQNEYEYLTSEETIEETIISNGYYFTEDGNLA